MGKKGLFVWVFSVLTMISGAHLVDALSVLMFGNQIKLLELYPLDRGTVANVNASTYFAVSITVTVVLWGITCLIAFDSPVETFLNTLLLDAEKQNGTESQIMAEKNDLIDVMNETVLTNSVSLGELKDLMYNVRAEVREITPLKDRLNRIQKDIIHLKNELSKFEELKYLKNVPSTEKLFAL